jgi:hypothetical protein
MRVIGEPLTDQERASFIRCIRSFINVPFGHQGRKPWKLDCVGAVEVSMQGWRRNAPWLEDKVGAFVREWLGRPTEGIGAYGQLPFHKQLERVLRRNLGEPVRDEPKAGDVVLMRFRGEQGDPQHVGVVSDHPDGGLRLIHSNSAVKRVAEHGLRGSWLRSVCEVYRP